MITRLAKWWLNKKGFKIQRKGLFVGVMMGGNCVATGNPERFTIYNPSKKIICLTGSCCFIEDNK